MTKDPESADKSCPLRSQHIFQILESRDDISVKQKTGFLFV